MAAARQAFLVAEVAFRVVAAVVDVEAFHHQAFPFHPYRVVAAVAAFLGAVVAFRRQAFPEAVVVQAVEACSASVAVLAVVAAPSACPEAVAPDPLRPYQAS